MLKCFETIHPQFHYLAFIKFGLSALYVLASDLKALSRLLLSRQNMNLALLLNKVWGALPCNLVWQTEK